MFTVYAIQSLSTERIYIGQTKDLNKRLQYHNLGYVKSTSRNRPWDLIAFVRFITSSEARWTERELKKSRGKRIKWIEENTLVKSAPPRRGRINWSDESRIQTISWLCH